MSAATHWTRTGSIYVKAPQEVPFGPGHKPERVTHVHGPVVRFRAGGKSGALRVGDVLKLSDFTTFTVENGTGTATLLHEVAS